MPATSAWVYSNVALTAKSKQRAQTSSTVLYAILVDRPSLARGVKPTLAIFLIMACGSPSIRDDLPCVEAADDVRSNFGSSAYSTKDLLSEKRSAAAIKDLYLVLQTTATCCVRHSDHAPITFGCSELPSQTDRRLTNSRTLVRPCTVSCSFHPRSRTKRCKVML